MVPIPTTVMKLSSSGEDCVSPADVLRRRLAMSEGLAQTYRDRYWALVQDLARESGSSVDEGLLEEYRQNQSGTCLPHALDLQQRAARLNGMLHLEKKKEGMSNTVTEEDVPEGAASISRAEQSSLVSLSKEMKEHGAFAVLCGMHDTFYIRSHLVTLGRGTRGVDGDVDIDVSQEALLCGCERSVSRLQARLFLDDGGFRIQNVGERPMSVNGRRLGTGEDAVLDTMSLISVAALSFIFIQSIQ
jgi:hypothetical protein